MYEKFTDRARKVMQLANQEAQQFNHEYIGTEHILLGLVKRPDCTGAQVLQNCGLTLLQVAAETERLIHAGPDMITLGKLPSTPRAKRVIEHAMEEARSLGHNYVGTEHILLGLLREQEGVAAQVLMNLGLKLEEARGEAVRVLASKATEPVILDSLIGGKESLTLLVVLSRKMMLEGIMEGRFGPFSTPELAQTCVVELSKHISTISAVIRTTTVEEEHAEQWKAAQ